jgi:hypothetical protein
VPIVGRVNNRPDMARVPRQGLADDSTSAGVPNSNGSISRSRDDALPIGRVRNGQHPSSVPL